MAEIFAVKLRLDESLKIALRPEQAADALSVSLTFLKKEIQEGKIEVVRKGRGSRRTTLITLASIAAYLEHNENDKDLEVE